MAFKKLRIAQIASISERVPPKKYGGTERVINELTEELVRRGHDVTLFASGDSKTSAHLVSIYPTSLREAKIPDPYGLNEWSLLHLGMAYQRYEEFDIIHDHTHLLSLPTIQFIPTPVVMTLHGAISPTNRRLFQQLPGPHFIAISKAQVQPISPIKVSDVIYNGLTMDHYPFQLKPKGYLLFVGRISMEKGLHFAINVALDLHLPLIIAAKLDTADRKYFDEYIEPRLSENLIEWVGEVDEPTRNDLMANALCMLHPVTFREPFGLTLIEAMACACPVVAFNQGSIPEIIINGENGYVVRDEEEMIQAVLSIDAIDRRKCREYSLGNFNAKLMTDRYETIYRSILK